MKKSAIIAIVLFLYLSSTACGVIENFFWYLGTGHDPYFILDDSRQSCDTLTLVGGSSTSHVVKVNDVEFNCEWKRSDGIHRDGDGFLCSGPYSSLDEEFTIEAYQVLLLDKPFSTYTRENQRDWNVCDFDADGAVDAEDSCPEDSEIWICPCDVGDGDLDGDGTVDCIDACPENPRKTEPGHCGCGESDVDTDGDGMADCEDECPNDPIRAEAGVCGCGVAETDTDGDQTPDCLDECPVDDEKTEPGICGCGLSDLDEDEDGLVLCNDICPGDAWHDEVGEPCNHDEDGDGTTDDVDGCPFDPKKTSPGLCGCGKTEASCQEH